MRNILICVLISLTLTGFSQLRQSVLTISDSTSTFGITVPTGSLIYNKTTGVLYGITEKFSSGSTLNSVLASGDYFVIGQDSIPEVGETYWYLDSNEVTEILLPYSELTSPWYLKSIENDGMVKVYLQNDGVDPVYPDISVGDAMTIFYTDDFMDPQEITLYVFQITGYGDSVRYNNDSVIIANCPCVFDSVIFTTYHNYTITADYHVRLDSSFQMIYNGAYLGYGDPLGEGNEGVYIYQNENDTLLAFSLAQKGNTPTAGMNIILSDNSNASISVSNDDMNDIRMAQMYASNGDTVEGKIDVIPGLVKIESDVTNISDSLYIGGNTELGDKLYFENLPDEATKVGRIMHISQYGEVEWVSPATLGDTIAEAGGGFWELTQEDSDTIKADYHVRLDSSFNMAYNGAEVGYKEITGIPFIVSYSGTIGGEGSGVATYMIPIAASETQINAASTGQAALLSVNNTVGGNPSLYTQVGDGDNITSIQTYPDTIGLYVYTGGLDDVATITSSLKMQPNVIEIESNVTNISDSLMVGSSVITPAAILDVNGTAIIRGDAEFQNATTFLDVIKLTPAADPPGSPTEGMIYYDIDDHKLKVYNGTTWQDLH